MWCLGSILYMPSGAFRPSSEYNNKCSRANLPSLSGDSSLQLLISRYTRHNACTHRRRKRLCGLSQSKYFCSMCETTTKSARPSAALTRIQGFFGALSKHKNSEVTDWAVHPEVAGHRLQSTKNLATRRPPRLVGTFEVSE